jgi:hypothetical protein
MWYWSIKSKDKLDQKKLLTNAIGKFCGTAPNAVTRDGRHCRIDVLTFEEFIQQYYVRHRKPIRV